MIQVYSKWCWFTLFFSDLQQDGTTISNSVRIVVIFFIEMNVRVNSLLQYLYILIPLDLGDVLVSSNVIILVSNLIA
jgi:hypothetical protein